MPTASTRSAGRIVVQAEDALDASRLPDGTVTALATGSLDGRHTLVVLTTLPDGSRSVDALLGPPCEVRPLS